MKNSMIFNVKQLCLGLACTTLLCGSAACSEIDEGLDKPAANFYPVNVGDATGVQVSALGVELDPHFFSQNVTRNDGVKAEDWNIVVDRVKKMGVQKFRIMIQPHWYEPVNDNNDPAVADLSKFTFDSKEMQSLYKVLDLAQANNVEVCLVLWGCPISFDLISGLYSGKHFLCDDRPNPGWVCGTDKYAEFAENFSTLVKWLIDTKGYTCVKEITPFNEPDSHQPNYGRMMWQGEPDQHPDMYAPMARALDARFKADGIRDKVRFDLSDNTDGSPNYLKSCAEALPNESDLFNSHTYIFGYDTPNSTILNWEKNNVALAALAGKPHFVGEFGSNQCVGSSRQKDIDLYKRGVLMTRLVINFLNAGACGVSYWSLIDQYYNRNASYSEMQQLGLWKSVKSAYASDPEVFNKIKTDYEVRPQYYSYSLLTRFVRSGSEIFPIEMGEDFVAGMAVKNAGGKWVYVFANGSEYSKPVQLVNAKGNADGQYDVYKYVENALPEGDNLIASSGTVKISAQKLEMSLPRQSVVIYVQQ